MKRVFVDESGNMGRDGQYFVLAALLVETPQAEIKLKRLIREEQIRGNLGEKLKKEERREELKFSRLRFSQRQRVVERIAKIDGIGLFYFVAYKPMVTLLQDGKGKNLIYNYFSKLLMRKIFKRYADDFEVIFDQRSTAVKSMNSLADYIEISAYTEFPMLKGKKIRVAQGDSKTNCLLQAADMVAGAAAQAYRMGNLHFLEILGYKIKVLEEFPKRGFSGRLKMAIGKRMIVNKLKR